VEMKITKMRNLLGKNKKHDPHRALNIDLTEKAIQKTPTPPVQTQEPIPKPIENPPVTIKKPKKKKTGEKEPKSKPKQKRERTDYKELISPVDDEEKRIVQPPTTVTNLPEEKPKKKKTKEKKINREENFRTTISIRYNER